MNHWNDDPARRQMHRRGLLRRFKSSLRTVMAVVGWVAVALAIFLAAATWHKTPTVQHRLITMSEIYAVSGVFIIVLHYSIFLLPDVLRERQSKSGQRRRQESRRPRSSRRIAPAPLTLTPPDPEKEGLALVFVLVMLGLIATLVVESQVIARSLLRRNASAVAMSSLRLAASDAARAALQRLADDEDLQVDDTNDTYFATEDLVTPEGIATRVTVVDENRFFDINNLAAKNVPPRRMPGDILEDAMTLAGNFTPSAYASALEDWVDADADGVTETRFYQDHTPPYATPNRVVYDWNELLAVDGGNREIFNPPARQSSLDTFNADLKDCVTVFPVPRERPVPLNVNTATREALQSVLGIGQDEAVRTILTLRELKPIRSLDTVFAVSDREFTDNLRPYLDVRSNEFRVNARAYADNREVNLRVLASRDSSGRVEILQWIL